MPGRQAKTIAPAVLARVLRHVRRHDKPIRSRVIVLLSIKAGLRSAEIAQLRWSMVVGADGRVADSISLEDRISKKKSGRRIPMHPDLRSALIQLRRGADGDGPVIRSRRGGHLTPGSVCNWFGVIFRDLQLAGCSSHSGRRTFVTRAARLTQRVGGSLLDVMVLAGHRSILSTQRYIDGDSDAQRRLVALL